MAEEDPIIAALLREREGYARYDKQDKVAEVDRELAARGYSVTTDAPAAAKEAEASHEAPETASLQAPESATTPRPKTRRSP